MPLFEAPRPRPTARVAFDGLAAPFAALALSAVEGVCAWMERAAQRRALMALDDRMLKDIGVARADVEAEYRKPAWRP